MAGQQSRSWTVVFVRGGDTESHSLRLRARTTLAVALIGLLFLLSVGWLAGREWHRARESERTAELVAEVERLSAERTQLMELAARLEELEADYRRLQRVLGSRGASPDGDIWFPPLEPGGDEAGGRESEGGLALEWPLAQRGYITRSHGRGSAGSQPLHSGIDIAVPAGSYVRASRAGVVADVGEDAVYGRYVRLFHEAGLSTLYGHNQWTFVSEGDSVEAKQVIALSGSTGQSTGPHLHFEARRRGRQVDPLELLGP